MTVKENTTSSSLIISNLMRVADNTSQMGINFHIYVRNQLPSVKEFSAIEDTEWQQVQLRIESTSEWFPEHRIEWNQLNHANQAHNLYCVHLKGGVTCYRMASIGKIQVIFDYNSDQQIVKELTNLINDIEYKPKNRVGLIQKSYGTLNVKFVEYRPYELEIIPYLGKEIESLKEEMLRSFNDESRGGLFLIHGKPGTGKTSFLKEILNQTEKQALFIPPSIATELSNPNLIALLMDHADSILIIEDAETVLMKREADNSDSVSNLLNMTDGFPADFLNLTIICTFNTDIREIDPALLRKGRLRGIQEFKELDVESARKLAQTIGSDLRFDRKMTVAEVCNEKSERNQYFDREIGFNNNTNGEL